MFLDRPQLTIDNSNTNKTSQKEINIYRFIFAMVKPQLSRKEALKRVEKAMALSDKNLILWLLKITRTPLNSRLISSVLCIAPNAVDYYLRFLQKEFKTTQNCSDFWFYLTETQQERAKLLAENNALLDEYCKYKKLFFVQPLDTLPTTELESLKKVFLETLSTVNDAQKNRKRFIRNSKKTNRTTTKKLSRD